MADLTHGDVDVASTTTEKKLGPGALIALVIGSMIGGGVFSLPQNFGAVASPGALLIGWVITGIGMLCLAFIYQNLSARCPELDGGIYSYARAGFGDFLGFQSAWGYWFSAWLGNVSYAVLLFSAMSFFIPVFGDGNNLPSIIGASVVLWLVHALVLRGVREAAWINTILTVVKVLVLMIFIIAVFIAFRLGVFNADFWGRLIQSNGAHSSVFAQTKNTMLVTTWVFIGIEGATVVSARAAHREDIGKATVIGLLGALAIFGLLEVLFFSSNLTKLGEGGWMPMALGAVIFLMLTTWKEGSRLLASQRGQIDVPMAGFIKGPLPDVPHVFGTAVYLTSEPSLVPSALFHNLKHYKVMHERTVFLHVVNEDIPRIDDEERVEVTQLAPGIYNVDARFGFREEPDVPAALALAAKYGLELEPMTTTYFVARSSIVDGPGQMPHWRCNLFAWMMRQSEGVAPYFKLPANQVVELGTQVML